ncbi:MAG: hypothetical protein V3T53_15940 [Phycisphaerales bacterium]
MWIKSSFTIPAVAAISFCLIGGPVPASARQVAGVCPGEGDCGEPHGTPGCENEECCLLVCAIEPFCCKVEWDEICVEIAIFLGCVAGPGDGELIATGGDDSIDGYMDVTSDGLGAEAVSFSGGPAWDDNYNPVDGPLQNPSFTTTTFLYTDTTALAMTLHSGSTGVWGRHGIFFLITADQGAFDTNGDGVNDTRVVDFVVSGGLSLDVTCTQHVERFLSVGGLPVATWTVTYDITNTGGASTFRIVRWGDVSSSWVGDATDDIVGTGTNEAAKCDRFVYIGEDGAPNFSITLSTNDPDAAYVGSKQDFDPDCEGPDIPFGSGTDSGQVWALHGFFDSYINQIAGVGQNADGESGTAPDDGCDPPPYWHRWLDRPAVYPLAGPRRGDHCRVQVHLRRDHSRRGELRRRALPLGPRQEWHRRRGRPARPAV